MKLQRLLATASLLFAGSWSYAQPTLSVHATECVVAHGADANQFQDELRNPAALARHLAHSGKLMGAARPQDGALHLREHGRDRGGPVQRWRVRYFRTPLASSSAWRCCLKTAKV